MTCCPHICERRSATIRNRASGEPPGAETCNGRERGGTCGQMQKFTAEKFHGVPWWFRLGTVSCRCTYHEHGLNPVDRGGAEFGFSRFLQVPGNRATGARSPAA